MKLLIIYIFTLLINISWAQMPNIILVITDDQGFGDFGFSGNQHIQTPHIDKFRDNSILLDNLWLLKTFSLIK